ncbi:hypothetical protein STEG23_026102 [Scotinomys teguina]
MPSKLRGRCCLNRASPLATRHQKAVSPFGMLGMSGGFMDIFGMMNDMIGNMEHMAAGGNCQTFSSSTVITGDGAPKVYQETSEMRSAPGGIRETRRTVCDSDSGLEQMFIGHHIRDRAHILQRSRNHRTGDQEGGRTTSTWMKARWQNYYSKSRVLSESQTAS